MILGEEGNILYAGPWLSDITGLKKDQLATLEQFEAQLRLPLEGDSRQALLEGKPTTAMVELQTQRALGGSTCNPSMTRGAALSS
jgi:hypothetical protein